MTKQRILIPGGAGYIGSHVVLSVLETRRYTVTVFDNYHNSFPTSMKRVSELALASLPADASQEDKDACQVEVVKGDLRDKAALEQLFASYRDEKKDPIRAVILVAALKAVGESGEIPIEYYDVNILGTINLLSVMHKYECRRMVYSSSATVYGIPKEIPIPETTPMAPESVYGRTKMMSELMLKDICDAYPGTGAGKEEWRCISLRYFNPAGAHPSGRIGEDPRGKPGNLLPLLAQMAVGKYREGGLKVFGNDYPTPDGTCVRDYIHIMDLAGGHVNALDALDKDAIFTPEAVSKGSAPGQASGPGKYRSFNLGKGKGMSVLQMVEAMRKVSGYEYPHTIVGRRLGDVPDLTADPAAAEKELGFKAKFELEDMSRDLWNWQSKNPKGYEEQ